MVAESSGPKEGIIETGSQFAIKTLPAPISRTETSTPARGPTITSREVAPLRRQMVLAFVFWLSFPRFGGGGNLIRLCSGDSSPRNESGRPSSLQPLRRSPQVSTTSLPL